MRDGPLYRIGAPITTQGPRTRCQECGTPTSDLWLVKGRSLCTSCRKAQPVEGVCLCCQGSPCVCAPGD